MKRLITQVHPKYQPPLDKEFLPAVLANRAFLDEVQNSDSAQSLILGLERPGGLLSRFETAVLPEGHPHADSNFEYVERILKFLLWQKGGYKVYVGGPQKIGAYITSCYSNGGLRNFDYHFMAEDVYERRFTVVSCDPEDVPPEFESDKPLGRHLDGCRIGFDLGASDRKASAVIDGEAVFSEEINWEPRTQKNPDYHYKEIMNSLDAAASHMPSVDAVGGSAAGIYIDNRVRIASLFRGVPQNEYHRVRNLFLRIKDEMKVPFEIINDGEVTALAGSMSLEDNGVLGIAMGSSEAGGYVNLQGNITGWLNELAFTPIDYNPAAPIDEWSGDRGVGGLYFSQQCIFRLAPKVQILIPPELPSADQLKFVQEKLEAGHEGAQQIWLSIGYYLGYGIAHYANFYDLKNILILGRCTSGRGGRLILDGAHQVLLGEFPELAKRIHIQLPDEKSRRVGQAIAAASLPELNKEVRK